MSDSLRRAGAMSGNQYRVWPPLFDHFVGESERRERQSEAEHLRSFKVEDQIDFPRSFSRDLVPSAIRTGILSPWVEGRLLCFCTAYLGSKLTGINNFEESDADRKIKMFNEDKGFGFIKPEDGGDDVFFHVSALREGDEITLGKVVNFEMGVDSKSGKPKAVSVDLI
jgi:CspA family cold shock protein